MGHGNFILIYSRVLKLNIKKEIEDKQLPVCCSKLGSTLS